jgi:hypothetical protein
MGAGFDIRGLLAPAPAAVCSYTKAVSLFNYARAVLEDLLLINLKKASRLSWVMIQTVPARHPLLATMLIQAAQSGELVLPPFPLEPDPHPSQEY